MNVWAYYGGDSDGTVEGAMASILATLRGQFWIYQTAHWQVVGTGSYGDHLLFQRLYEGVQEEIDGIGEKLVGYFGVQAVDPMLSIGAAHARVAQWCEIEDLVARGLQAESDLQGALRSANRLQGLPLGLQDWLAATASAHETHTYLLQQRRKMAAAVESGPAAPSAEESFWHNPERYEVRQLAETGAPTNDPAVAEESGAGMDLSKREIRKDVAEAEAAPPTPTEIKDDLPGGEEFSTLNRYVVTTEQSVPGGIPERPMTPDSEESFAGGKLSKSRKGNGPTPDRVSRAYWRLQ